MRSVILMNCIILNVFFVVHYYYYYVVDGVMYASSRNSRLVEARYLVVGVLMVLLKWARMNHF